MSGQGGRHHAAEDHDQQDQRDGQGDHLGPQQVLLQRLADVVEDLGEAADLDRDRLARAVLAVARPELGDALLHLVVVAGDVGDDEGPVAVVVAQRRGAALRPVGHDVGDVVLGGQLVGQGPPGLGHLGGVHVAAGGGDEEDEVGHAGVEPLGQGVLRAGGFRRRVDEPARRQVLGDPAAEGAGEHDEQDGGDQHAAAAPGREVGEAREHGGPPGARANTVTLSLVSDSVAGAPVQMTSVTRPSPCR